MVIVTEYWTHTESVLYDAQENPELPPHPVGLSERPFPESEDPAEISFVTFSLLHLLQWTFLFSSDVVVNSSNTASQSLHLYS